MLSTSSMALRKSRSSVDLIITSLDSVRAFAQRFFQKVPVVDQVNDFLKKIYR